MKKILLTTLASAALVAAVQAAPTYIDFATPAGTTGTVGGNIWNNASTASTSLVDTAGTASGTMTLAFTNANADGTTPGFGGGAFNSGDTVGSTAPAFLMNGGTPIASAIGDGLFTNDGFGGDYATISFSGFAASTVYTFTVYGGRNDANFANTALFQDATGTTNIASYTNRTSATFNVTTDGAGALSFRFTEGGELASNTGSNATLSGMSIAIPEPSSFAVLLGFAGLGLALTRRQRKA